MAKVILPIPNSNLSGLPIVTQQQLNDGDPNIINNICRLLATQISGVQRALSTAGISTTGVALVPAPNPLIPASGSSSGSGAGSGGGASLGSTVITVQGTHIQRLGTFLAPTEPVGCFYYETDRAVTYLNFLNAGNVRQWIWQSGTMFDINANRPGDLVSTDAGFLFFATDLSLLYRWGGGTWSVYSNVEIVLQNTHAQRLSTFPSVSYSPNTIFFETDRKLFYITQNATGTLTVAGGVNVTWSTGDKFVNTGGGFTAAQYPAGTPITINGVATTIAVAVSSTSITLQTAVANAAGVAFTIPSGLWVYCTGEYDAAYASKPTDWGINDTNAQFADNATYYRSWTWNGLAFVYTIGQSPYLAVQMTMANTPDLGWVAADGSVGVTVTKPDGTTTTVTLPNPVGYFLQGGVYSGVQVAAVKSTINTFTPAGTASAPTFTGSAAASVAVQAGAGTSVVGAPYTPSGSNNSVSFTGTPVTPTTNIEGAPPTMLFSVWIKL